MRRILSKGVLLILTLVFFGCPHHQPLRKEPHPALFGSKSESTGTLNRFCPFFICYEYESAYNRIGSPEAHRLESGQVRVQVNPDRPTIFTNQRYFTTRRQTYMNLIYRVHFSKVPFRLIPFYINAGKNVGLMVMITLDSERRPVLVTTVHTCGCYLAIIPTTYLPKDAYPDSWRHEPLDVYGETLPNELDFDKVNEPKVLVHLRPGVHRVINLEIVDKGQLNSERYRFYPSALTSTAYLKKLPSEGDFFNFFHDDGLMKGFVRGSIKPLETLFLGVFAMDFFVGTDKAYDDPAKTDNPFYTSLKPWNRNVSNMWYFKSFLEFWGWHL